MAVRDHIAIFLSRIAPAPFCDQCIASRNGLSHGAVNKDIRRLVYGPGGSAYHRDKGECTDCGKTLLVTYRDEDAHP